MSYTYEPRTLTHSTEYGFYAANTTNIATGAVEFGKAYEYTGLQSVKIETSQDYEDKYADGRVHLSIAGAEKVSGEIGSLQIRPEFWKDALGKKVNELKIGKGVRSTTNTGTKKSVIFGFAEIITDEFNNETKQWTLITNVKASMPTMESATDEDKVTEVVYTVPVSMSPNSAILDDEGKPVTIITVTDDADGTVTKLIGGMFGENPTNTVQSVLDVLLGKSEEVTPGGE